MSSVRAVFLDVGGTLLHLDREYILACLAERGLERDLAAFHAADRAARTHVDELLRSNDPGNDVSRWRAYAATMLDSLGCTGDDADAVRKRLHEHNTAGRLWSHAEPGTVEALATLRANGYTLVVVSNSDGRVTRFLETAGILAMVDAVIDSGTVGVEKPDPRIFHIACDRAGVTPEEAVHVGDIFDIDVKGARAAGVEAVLIDPQDLMPQADAVRIRSLTELPELLPRAAASPDQKSISTV